MKTAVERAFERGELRKPTEVLANGCGAGWTKFIVPDEIADVEFADTCCDPHDLAYAIGGFWGLFYRKPRADIALGACMVRRFYRAAECDWIMSRNLRSVAKLILGTVAGPLYTLAVMLIGWTPFVWPWKKRDFSSAELAALGELIEANR